MERVFCLLLGYVFGLFQTAIIYGKVHGVDITKHGSGNPGTTNTLRVMGAKAGGMVLLGDALKTIIPIVIIRCTLGAAHPEMKLLDALYVGAGAILGHNYPFYLKFKGGKGIAATAGLIIAFNPWFVLVGIIVFFGNFFITHYVSVGSLLVYITFMIEMVLFGQKGWLGDIPQVVLNEMYIITFLLACLAFWKHRTNIVKLIHGNERKTYLSKDKNKAE